MTIAAADAISVEQLRRDAARLPDYRRRASPGRSTSRKIKPAPILQNRFINLLSPSATYLCIPSDRLAVRWHQRRMSSALSML